MTTVRVEWDDGEVEDMRFGRAASASAFIQFKKLNPAVKAVKILEEKNAKPTPRKR